MIFQKREAFFGDEDLILRQEQDSPAELFTRCFFVL